MKFLHVGFCGARIKTWAFTSALVLMFSVPEMGRADVGSAQTPTGGATVPAVKGNNIAKSGAAEMAPEMEDVEPDFAVWQVSIGPAYRMGSSLKVNWSQDSVHSAINRFMRRRASNSGSLPPVSGYTDRNYVDGFVYRDLGTEDPETDEAGLTWYWGHDSASQYDGSSLAFNTGGTRTEQTTFLVQAEDATGTDDFDLPGFDLSGSWRAKRFGAHGDYVIGVSGGFSWFADQNSSFAVQRRVAREMEATVRYTDHYSAPYPQFPSAPHVGTLDGPGYLINNIPDARTADTISSRSVDWIAHSDLELDVSVFDFRLGPSLWYECSERYFARVTSHLRLAYVELDATANTIVTAGNRQVAQFRAADREKDWVWGAGIELELGIRLSNTWLLGFSGAYDWWADDVAVSADPYRADFELGNWTVMATIGREF